ncbi:hypothetical protein P154DRAFT_620609 [Amniculicola lignicola CBS 123094]|uniref:SRR1-like domain-containing protein n=1 Tax=Amniculicola lignicola CBS 123094 TaxID=1392246 RepID=A0A6A5WDH9_9PLEO|nr:hypothetical protein P154DRAFT_620609 [Amniculicola lignicola CBS 123094]
MELEPTTIFHWMFTQPIKGSHGYGISHVQAEHALQSEHHSDPNTTPIRTAIQFEQQSNSNSNPIRTAIQFEQQSNSNSNPIRITPLFKQQPYIFYMTTNTNSRFLTINNIPPPITEDGLPYMTRSVNLDVHSTPIFTRTLMEHIGKRVEEDSRIFPAEKSKDINGNKWKVLRARKLTTSVQYLTYVELTQQYYDEVKGKSSTVANPLFEDRIQTLRLYNKGERFIPMPYFLTQTLNPHYTDEEEDDLVEEDGLVEAEEDWQVVQKLWQKSHSRRQLRTLIKSNAKGMAQIKNIVCIGLGQFQSPSGHKSGLLQHLTAFDIAAALKERYKEANPGSTPIDIEIIAQDPCYTYIEKKILPKYYSRISFVSDPQGFLAIDEHTLVIAPFLPTEVPYLQIIADMFDGKSVGPAGILCDVHNKSNQPLNLQQKNFTFLDRTSPRANKMLERYKRFHFQDHRVELDFYDEIYPDKEGRGRNRNCWLWKMDLFLKPKLA